MNPDAVRDDDSLRRDPITVCERIICVQRPDEDSDWWRELLREGAEPSPLEGRVAVLPEADDSQRTRRLEPFLPEGRATTTQLDGAAKAAQEAVASGYRPIFFLSDPSDWPRVYDGLGVHKTFCEIYALGRDDEAMRRLLFQPSTEILDAYQFGGFIAVPDAGYGAALDRVLPADLADFEWTGGVEGANEIEPCFALTSRLNAFRQLGLILDRRDGHVALKQSLIGVDDEYAAPIRFRGKTLAFENGECDIDEGTEWTAAVTDLFELPEAFRGWAPDRPKPWGRLVRKIRRQMSRGVAAYLTVPELSLLAIEDIVSLMQPVAMPRTRGKPAVVRTRGYRRGAERERRTQSKDRIPDGSPIIGAIEPLAFDELQNLCKQKYAALQDSASKDDQATSARLSRFIRELEARSRSGSEVSLGSAGCRIVIHWVGAAPKAPPALEFDADGVAAEPCPLFWDTGLERLVLIGTPLEGREIGWQWKSEDNRLLVLTRASSPGADPR